MKLTLQLLLSSLLISLSLQKELFKWRYIDYDWLGEGMEKYYIENGLYVKNASPAIDALIANGKVFISIPRASGVPASVGTLNKNKIRGEGPVVTPYPSWDWADTRKNCNETIISVYRMDIDNCNRLWILDNGKNGDITLCPQKLIAFDIETNKAVIIKEIPNKYGADKNGKGVLATPLIVTHGKKCEHITAYMADIEGYALVVWRGGDEFQRFESPLFANDPKASYFDLDGDKMYLNDGLVGLALYIDGLNPNCNTLFCNKLYLSSLSSYDMFHVSVNSLKKSNSSNIEIIQDKGNFRLRKVALAIERHSMYFCSIEDYSLRKWDVRTAYDKKNVKVIKTDKKLLNFVSGLKIRKSKILRKHNCTQVYGLANKYERTGTKTRNTNEINYNIFSYNLCGKDGPYE
ncbi:PREDICTED: major royal jelly protein 1-like [Polistes dominula]|uniref:Major royal jelly protein 1-like n=1 Tax=Polistes dominula TaxID=743375 RepID=A0ABM1JDH1_POLDO|nr:PREDICTED: major royal jelly protein 1-like [Polistes dominula]